MSENELATLAIGCGLKVHKALEPGLLENAYLECLVYELKKLGLRVEKQNTLLFRDGIRRVIL